MPSHNHSGSTDDSGDHNHDHDGRTDVDGSHTHEIKTYKDPKRFERGNGTGWGTVRNNFKANKPALGADLNTNRRDFNSLYKVHFFPNFRWITSKIELTGPNYDSREQSHSHTFTTTSVPHTHTLSINNTGGGEAHENRPPYYTLAYIMKL